MGKYGAFNPSYTGLGEFLCGEEMKAHLQSRLDRMKEGAEALAPVGPPGDKHRGEYKASFRTEVEIGEPFKGGPRQIGHLYNEAPYAAAVEWGYRGRSDDPTGSAHFVMTRAIDFLRDE